MKSPQNSKYYPLFQRLLDRPKEPWRPSFAEIEALLNFHLPPSARKRRAWWANSSKGHNHAIWLDAGWRTKSVDLGGERVTLFPEAGALLVEPPVDKNLYLIKVNEQFCPGGEADPDAWEDEVFVEVALLGEGADDDDVVQEKRIPPKAGDMTLIWVNGTGLVAWAQVAEYPVDGDKSRIRVDEVHTLSGKLVGNEYLRTVPQQDYADPVGSLKRDQGTRLRWISEALWSQLLLVHDIVNSDKGADEVAELMGAARLTVGIMSRAGRSGKTSTRTNPLRIADTYKETQDAILAKMRSQERLCGLCECLIHERSDNPMLKMSVDRIDSSDPRYVGDSFHITHRACNWAKNACTGEQFAHWVEVIRHKP